MFTNKLGNRSQMRDQVSDAGELDRSMLRMAAVGCIVWSVLLALGTLGTSRYGMNMPSIFLASVSAVLGVSGIALLAASIILGRTKRVEVKRVETNL